jgi:hypothetical protein
VLTPSLDIEDATAAEKLKRSRLVPEIMSIDRDWDFMEPILSGGLRADVRPWPTSADSWHFYRHNLAAWNLNGMEAIEAITFAGKTHATLRRGSLFELRRIQVIFQTDRRAQP